MNTPTPETQVQTHEIQTQTEVAAQPHRLAAAAAKTTALAIAFIAASMRPEEMPRFTPELDLTQINPRNALSDEPLEKLLEKRNSDKRLTESDLIAILRKKFTALADTDHLLNHGRPVYLPMTGKDGSTVCYLILGIDHLRKRIDRAPVSPSQSLLPGAYVMEKRLVNRSHSKKKQTTAQESRTA